MTAFDDLEDAVSSEQQSKTSPESSESQSSQDSQDSEESRDPRETPAFEFSADLRRSIYARKESWEKFEDARDLEMTRALRNASVRNHESREVHDAMVRLAAKNPGQLAQLILKARGVDEEIESE